MHGLEHQVGDGVGGVAAVAVVAAQVHIGGVPQQQARDEEDGALVVQGPGGRLPRVVGVEQRVQPAQGAAAVVGAAGHLVPEEELARLLKRLGLCVRDLAVERAQVAQVRGDLRVRNARRQLRRDAGIGVDAAGEGGRLPVAEHALVVGDVHDVLGHIARLVPLARGVVVIERVLRGKERDVLMRNFWGTKRRTGRNSVLFSA